VCCATFPAFNPAHLVEHAFEYPVSFNGKLRFKKMLPLGISPSEAQAQILADENTTKYLDGKPLKKFVFVEGKIVNVVC
jgi:leucyl-tRNA synthetase